MGVGAAAVPAAIGIAFLGRYGWDRDELYFLAASHHLAAGYVALVGLMAFQVDPYPRVTKSAAEGVEA